MTRVGRAIALAPALLVIAVLFGGGLWMAALQSVGRLPMTGPSTTSLDAYRTLVGRPELWASVRFSLWIALASTAVAAAIGVGAALLFRPRFRARRVALALFGVALPVPYAVAAVLVTLGLGQSGLVARIGNALGLIGSPAAMPALTQDPYGFGIIVAYGWKAGVFMAFVLLGAMRRTGTLAEEAARTLGAGRWQRLRHVTLPALAPSLGAGSALVFAFAFGSFEVPFLLGRRLPQALPVLAWRSFVDIDLARRDEAAAVGLLIAFVAAAVLLLAVGGSRLVVAHRAGALRRAIP